MLYLSMPVIKGVCLTALGAGVASLAYMFYKQGVFADQTVGEAITKTAMLGCLVGGGMLAVGGVSKIMNGGAY